MATFVSYNPSSLFTRAMFNFDASGISDYLISGTIRVSVSDGFSNADYSLGLVSSTDYTLNPYSNEITWATSTKSNIQAILTIFSSFANLTFSTVTDYDTSGNGLYSIASPADVGAAGVSDINIAYTYDSRTYMLGVSSLNFDFGVNGFGYTGARGDIFINTSATLFNIDGVTFDDFTKSHQVLMHELEHSLGVSHPFSGANVTSDFGLTRTAGFSQFGFKTDTAADMNKEYFTIMSYDDESTQPYLNAYTPMIMDVIALQQAYGEGAGTSGTGDSTISVGTIGYRTYYDRGGNDSVNLSMYTSGVYFHLGASIAGADHLVGIAMSMADRQALSSGGNPQSLRWFYGEFENATGGIGGDTIIGNSLANSIYGDSGNDALTGGTGNDAIDGGDGSDTAIFGISTSAVTSCTRAFSGNNYVITSSEGIDTLTNIEYIQCQSSTYSMSDFYALLNPSSSTPSTTTTNTISPITYAATYAIPVSSIQSIGLSPDGHYLLIKVGGETKVVAAGSTIDFNGSSVTTTDLTNSISQIPVFKSSGGTGGFALPDLYTGPASLGIKYQLIETAYNAVVTGSSDNDFIKVSSSNSIGKAVNGGGGNDVIDGGVGSTFVTGGTNHNTTFFLDGRAPGTSWSTITDFKNGVDKATIWGFVKGVSSIDTSFANYNSEGAAGYTGLTLHFKNLLPDGQTSGSNANLNSITFSGHTLAELGASSLADLNSQINAGSNAHILVGSTQDASGTHSYLYIH